MVTEGLDYSVGQRVASVTFTRPDTLNLLTEDVLVRLHEIAAELADRSDVDVLTITGTGTLCFSTGILTPALRGILSKPDVLKLIRIANEAFDAIEALPQIVIAGLNGVVRAGAGELALACDIRIAGDHITWASPEARWGGFPGVGAPIRLPGIIGVARALDLLCTGREIDAREIDRIGLADVMVGRDAVHDRLIEMARSIAENGPLATKGAKQIIREREAAGFTAARRLSDRLRASLEWTSDVDEGIAAVREERKPVFGRYGRADLPFADINSVRLHYKVLGDHGPWVALVSGARRNMDEVRGLATVVAGAGFRVLLHDRRNTGESSLSLDGEGSEFEIWADDLRVLVKHLGLPRIVVGGSSSGCRLATIMALRHRDTVCALLMMRVTGGAFAVKRLSGVYYTQYIEAAGRGGMEEVCRIDHFQDLIAQNPARRQQLMAWNSGRFIDVMSRWRENLEAGIDDPMLGAGERDLRGIDFPVCVIPGNDRTHSIASGLKVHSLIPRAELHELRTDQLDADLITMDEWVPNDRLAPVVIGFISHATARCAS